DVRHGRARLLLRPVKRIVRDEAAAKLPRLRIERELLDDVQLIAVRQPAVEEARPEADRVDDQRVAFPATDRMPGGARLGVGGARPHAQGDRAPGPDPAVLEGERGGALSRAVEHLAGRAGPWRRDGREHARRLVPGAGRHRLERGRTGLGETRAAAETERPAAA